VNVHLDKFTKKAVSLIETAVTEKLF